MGEETLQESNDQTAKTTLDWPAIDASDSEVLVWWKQVKKDGLTPLGPGRYATREWTSIRPLLAAAHAKEREYMSSESNLKKLKAKVHSLLVGLPVSAAKGILNRLVEEIDFDSVVISLPIGDKDNT